MQFEPFHFNSITPGADAAAANHRSRGFVLQSFGKHVAIEEVKEDTPPPPPTFSEEQLLAAKEDSYRKGFLDGETQGKGFAESELAMIEKQTHALMQPMAEQVLALFTHYNQFVIKQKIMLPKLALAIAQKSSKKMLSDEALLHVESVAVSCIERMLGEPELHVFVHPSLSDALEKKLTQHFAKNHEPGDVVIHKDEHLILGACRIEWKHGGLEYSPETFWTEMEKIIDGVTAADAQMHEEINENTVFQQIEATTVSTLVEDENTNAAIVDIIADNITQDNPKE